jgi:replication-associated recombination protein RarA
MPSNQSPKGALLVSGEPGSGKTEWIRAQAKLHKAKLFRWNTRIDRSLREGREVLHQQVRARDTMYVWLEGADDLTQEAQAFLRRILETASPNITCVLEVREPWKLSPPILSRCTLVNMSSKISYRKAKNVEEACRLGLLKTTQIPEHPRWDEIPQMREAGLDPFEIFDQCFKQCGYDNKNLQRALTAIGSGASPWAQLAYFLHSQSSA